MNIFFAMIDPAQRRDENQRQEILADGPRLDRIGSRNSRRNDDSRHARRTGRALPGRFQIDESQNHFGKALNGMAFSRRLIGAYMVVLAVSAGCGVDTYEYRLEETRRYYSYLDRLNHFLGPAWAAQGVELRVPRQFSLMAPPGAPADKDAPPPRDPRQPTFAQLDLPGLQGAWEGSLSLAGNEGRAPGYLYVLSNAQLTMEGAPKEKEAAFNRDVVETIAKAIGQPVPDLDKCPTLQRPKKGIEAYVPPVKYKIITPGLPTTVNDKEYRIQIYSFAKPKAVSQITIVLIAPQDVSGSEKLEQAMDLCLETLAVRALPPKLPQAGKGPAPPKARGI